MTTFLALFEIDDELELDSSSPLLVEGFNPSP